jgi:hypothetical protein
MCRVEWTLPQTSEWPWIHYPQLVPQQVLLAVPPIQQGALCCLHFWGYHPSPSHHCGYCTNDTSGPFLVLYKLSPSNNGCVTLGNVKQRLQLISPFPKLGAYTAQP